MFPWSHTHTCTHQNELVVAVLCSKTLQCHVRKCQKCIHKWLHISHPLANLWVSTFACAWRCNEQPLLCGRIIDTLLCSRSLVANQQQTHLIWLNGPWTCPAYNHKCRTETVSAQAERFIKHMNHLTTPSMQMHCVLRVIRLGHTVFPPFHPTINLLSLTRC